MLNYIIDSIKAITGITEAAILTPIAQLVVLFFFVSVIYLLFNLVFNKKSAIKTTGYVIMMVVIALVVLNVNGINPIQIVESLAPSVV